jgi:hypothetical protein
VLSAFATTLVISVAYAAAFLATTAFCVEKFLARKYLEAFLGLAAVGAVLRFQGTGFSRAVPTLFCMLLVLGLGRGADVRKHLPAVVGAMLAILFPLWSSNGLTNSCFALWFLLPGVLVAVDGPRNRAICRAALGCALLIGIYASVAKPYWDHGVLSLDCVIDNARAGRIWTQCDRKVVVDGLVSEVKKYAGEDDEIFVYQNSPMVYILTGTRPWVPYPWPYLIQVSAIEKAFADKERISLPRVIVRERLSPFGSDWPNSTEPPLETIGGGRRYAGLYDGFIARHGYAVVYRNAMFELLAREEPSRHGGHLQ